MASAGRWKAWYDNGATFSSEDCTPEDLPADGLLVVVHKKADHNVVVHEGCDYYFWNGTGWVSGDIASLEKWLRCVLPRLKYGLWTRDGLFREAIEESARWP